MNENKKYLIIFLLLLIAFVFMGGVSANDLDNTTTSVSNDNIDETMLIDNTLYANNNESYVDSNSEDINETPDKNSKFIYLSNLSTNHDEEVIFKDSYTVNAPIVNPDFEDSNIPIGWNYSSVGITTFTANAKNGDRFARLSNGGHVSQFVNCDSLDSIQFWYMSNTKGSSINIYLDDNLFSKYAIQKTGFSKTSWEKVSLDLSSITGYHTFKISQTNGMGYLDFFTWSYNNNLYPNFTIGSFSIDGNECCLNFSDLSFGLIDSCLWDFGDGVTSTLQNPEHTYNSLNKYSVTLTVYGNGNSKSYTIDNILNFIGGVKNNRNNNTYLFLQDAIDEAQNDDIIYVNKLYNPENIVINKNISLIAVKHVSLTPFNFNKPIITINESKVLINGFSLSKSYIGIQINNGDVHIVNNSIYDNVIGLDVLGGQSSINFNNLYNNSLYSLRFIGDNVDFNNNYWNTNNPIFVNEFNVSEYADIYQAEHSNKFWNYSWILLNVDISKRILRTDDSSFIFIDFTKNNIEENISSKGLIPIDYYVCSAYTYEILENNPNFLILKLVAGKTNGIFDLILYYNNKSENISFIVDDVVPNITYVTPSTIFKDSILVEIRSDDDTAIIYYTLDGTNPVNSSTRLEYNEPFLVNDSVCMHFTAIDAAGNYAMFNYNFTEFTGSLFFYETKSYEYVVTYLKESDLVESNGIWNQYQDNGGVSSYSGSLTNLTKWSKEIVSSGSVVIDDKGHIYVGSDDGYLYCLNNQGLVIWRYGTASKIICTPAVGYDGNIYFSNWMNSTLYCLSPNGELIWKYVLGDYNTGSSPIFGRDGTLYVLTSNEGNSTLFAFKNQKLLWDCNLPEISASTPFFDSEGTLYLVSNNHELIAINWDGSLKYSFSLIKIFENRKIDDDLHEIKVSVSIGDDDTIYVINQPHYKDVWGKPISWGFIRAYYSNATLKWYSGKLLNNFALSGVPTIYKNVLYVIEESNLMAINASNGAILWSANINDVPYSTSSPLISNEGIIYVSHGDMVYAFDLNGEQLWNYTLTGKYGNPFSLSSPVLSNDGTLIVTTNQGIFAFNDVSADFTYVHVNNTELTIRFTDISTSGKNSYFWDFGDGSYSLEQNPIHNYTAPGKYRVVLIVEHNGVNLARNTTIEVIKYDLTPPSNVDAYINDIILSGGVFDTAQNVTLVASDDAGSVTIYYTVDGSNPINSSTRRTYYEPILIEANTVLNAVAVDESDNFGEVSSISFEIKDALNVNDLINSTLIQKIQDLLDNAEEGSKFVFDYDVLYGANFTINKPLNIITTNNTKLIGNGNQPVFTLSESAKGTTINGFTIENNNADGILIKNASDITVKETIVNVDNSTGINIINSDKISIKDTSINNAIDGIIVNQSTNTYLNRVDVEDSYNNGVWIYKSQSTIIANSLLENNGKDPYKSKANQVLIDDSKDAALYNNTLNYGYFGVHLYHNTDGVILDNNTIYESIGDAILLSNRYSNVDITHNLIDGCYNGVNFMGFSQNVTIKQNTIENLHEHEGDLQSFKIETLIYELADYVYEYHFPGDQFFNHCYNGIQLSHGASNVHEGNTIMVDNVIIKVQHRAWESRKYQGHLDTGCAGYGYNLYDGSDSYHGTGGATSYREGKVDLVLDRVGDSSFRLRLINRLDGHYLSDIPEFDVTFIAGGFSQTVKFKGSEAVATFDTSSTITAIVGKISGEIQKSVAFDIPITDGYSSSNKDKDPGYEAGEAINNPNPVIPSIKDMINRFGGNNGNGNGQGSGNGNGQGTGTGNGQGSGNGHGSSGHGGSSINGREGEVEGDSNNLIRTNGGTSPSVGVQNAVQGDSDSVEGGSAVGGSIEDSSNAYEVTKVINKDINDNWQFVLAVILFSIFIILGYGYRRGKKDGDEI